jgi:AcrR family transcriptional regulator
VRANKSAARRSAILAAALEEFREKGFAATRVEDVAARAGVAKGTIYLNFKEKEALFEELIRSAVGSHVARLQAIRPDSGQSMRDQIEGVGLPMIEAARSGRLGDLLRLMLAESGRFPHLAEFYYREVLEPVMGAIRRLAAEALRSGELPGDHLVRFPQIIGAPVVVTLLWTTLFEKFAPLDTAEMMRAYLDLIFARPLQDGPAGSGSTGK